MMILGPQADPVANSQYAAQKALQETAVLSGRDLYFAWYNLGSNRVALQDYAGAAQAYDQAFALYPSIPEDDRPWRMLWYQTGPYPAYYYTGRYQDVIQLGTQTLSLLGQPILEETLYWMGMAREAQGDLEKAIADYQKAVDINPSSTPARQELVRLGIEYP
jgi:tetratricopeptide (TPR) repeat protein